MKILIIEDESIIARRIMRMTQLYYGSVLKSINHCDVLEEGLEFLNEHEVDLLLLDLNINGADGFEVLKQMVSQSFHTIIISAYKEKAIDAFEFGVLDFVAKPFNEKRLSQALSRITQTNRAQESGLKYLAIQKKSAQHLIEVADILYIQGARIYTEIYLSKNKKEIHNKSLDKLMSILPTSHERIHKSYIADMHKAIGLRIESGGKYTLELQGDVRLPVSRSRYKELKKRWFK